MGWVYSEDDLVKPTVSTHPDKEDYPQYALHNCSVRNRVDYRLTDVLNVNEFPLGLVITGDIIPNDARGNDCLTPKARKVLKKDKRVSVFLKGVFTYSIETDFAAHTIKIWVLGERGWYWIKQASPDYDELFRVCLMKGMVFDAFDRLFVSCTRREFDATKRMTTLEGWKRETIRSFPEFMQLMGDENVGFDAFILHNAKWIWGKVMDAKDTSGSLMYIQRGEELPVVQFFYDITPDDHRRAIHEIRDRDRRMVEQEAVESGKLAKIWYFDRAEVAKKAQTVVSAYWRFLIAKYGKEQSIDHSMVTAESLQEFVANNWEWVDKRASKFVVYAIAHEALQYLSTEKFWRDTPLYRDFRLMHTRDFPEGCFALYLVPKKKAEMKNGEVKTELMERNRVILMDVLGPTFEYENNDLFNNTIMTGEDLAQFKKLTNRGDASKAGSYQTLTAAPSDAPSVIETDGALALPKTPPKKSLTVTLKIPKNFDPAAPRETIYIKTEPPSHNAKPVKKFPGLSGRLSQAGIKKEAGTKKRLSEANITTPKAAKMAKVQKHQKPPKTPKPAVATPSKRGRPQSSAIKNGDRRIKRKTEASIYDDAEMMDYDEERPDIPSSEMTSAPPTSADQSLQEYTPMTDTVNDSNGRGYTSLISNPPKISRHNAMVITPWGTRIPPSSLRPFNEATVSPGQYIDPTQFSIVIPTMTGDLNYVDYGFLSRMRLSHLVMLENYYWNCPNCEIRLEFADNASIHGRWVRCYKHLLGHLEGMGKELMGMTTGIGQFNMVSQLQIVYRPPECYRHCDPPLPTPAADDNIETCGLTMDEIFGETINADAYQ